MRGRTLGWILVVVFMFDTRLEASCIESAQLAHSAVSITRYFDEKERAASSGVIGARGTAWFLSPATMVTAEHVSAGMKLTTQDWRALDVRHGDDGRSVAARVAYVTGSGAEKLAVIELQSEFPGARRAPIRTAPLTPEDQVVTIAYRDGRPRVVSGRFVKYGNDKTFAGAALLEMFDGDDRLAVDHGASGAPVFDCEGRVAAVVSIVITQNVWLPTGKMRVSTAWGTPNVVSVPIREMTEALQVR